MTTNPVDSTLIATAMLKLAAERGAAASFCPSDIARQLAGPAPDQWSRLMQPIRRVAVELAQAGRLVILRKGKPVDPLDFKGVYRLAQPRFD